MTAVDFQKFITLSSGQKQRIVNRTKTFIAPVCAVLYIV